MKNPPAYEMLLNRWQRATENIRHRPTTSSAEMARVAVDQLSAINTYRAVIGYVKAF